MATQRKYKIGDKVHLFKIISYNINSKTPYNVQCECGVILKKNTQALSRIKSCLKCSFKVERKKVKNYAFSIGDKINQYEVVGYDKVKTRNLYVLKCSCGNIVKKLSEQARKSTCCIKCKYKQRTDKHIGNTYCNCTVIENVKDGNNTKLKVKCNICLNEFFTTKSAIQNRKYCKNCIGGHFPGKIINNMTLLERSGKGYWNILCECGKVFRNSLKTHNGKIASCGCRKRKEALLNAEKKIGLKFKHIKINKIHGFIEKHLWLELKCVCGKKFIRPNGNEFKSESCGCRWHENAPKGENSFLSKLTEVEVLTIREFFESNAYSFDELKQIFNLSKEGLRKIIIRKSWAHI